MLAANDRSFAEPVRLSPMKNGRPDPDRPQTVFEAVLRSAEQDVVAPNGSAASTAQDWRSRVATVAAKLHIDRATYTGPAFAVGDTIRALARPGEPCFTVGHVNTAAEPRLELHLIEAGN